MWKDGLPVLPLETWHVLKFQCDDYSVFQACVQSEYDSQYVNEAVIVSAL